MTIQHKNIAEADLHEPKGVSVAAVGKTYVSDGAGSGSWIYSNARGSIAFSNVGAPVTITYPSVYTKASVTTTASGLAADFTEASTSRLTYTGTLTRPFRITANIFLDQTSGAARNIQAALYKNGSIIATSENMIGTATATAANITLYVDVSLVTNDYIEIYIKNTGVSGDVRIYTLWLGAVALGRS